METPREPAFKSLFESAPGLYLVLTPEFVIVAMSDTFLQATMTEREQILNRCVFDAFPDNPAQPEAGGCRNLRASLQHVVEHGVSHVMPVQRHDIRQPQAAGGAFEERHWSSFNIPVFAAGGELQYIIHRVEDVTPFVRQKQPGGRMDMEILPRDQLVNDKARAEKSLQEAYQRLERMNSDLESRVADRTRQLEDTIKELESFSYSVSHDLKAPLRAIDGFSRILIEEYSDKLDENGQRVLAIIRNSTLKMGELIESLLALARLGRKQMRLIDVDMGAMVAAIFSEVWAAAPARVVELQYGALHRVKADPVLLQQVMTNLLSNAFKFTRDRNPAVIEIESRLADEGREAVFSVRDNGVGFEMKYVDKLFGVFQRLHTDLEFDGTGVGLAIVQRAIQRHGGRVWAESELNRGATFYFSLPCTVEADEITGDRDSAVRPPANSTPDTRRG